ncbi:hypothetical protein BCR39DRAFT_534333 [Naematelia encephala]|uniref:Uncharacterized protein n=1 Tax=Naematelia encephala TaxID=71784 RepID=A0A1Y2B292_9TREE|nr:hypothetical protein BCR39DRAFT_534333 [Naematelia encephala]
MHFAAGDLSHSQDPNRTLAMAIRRMISMGRYSVDITEAISHYESVYHLCLCICIAI